MITRPSSAASALVVLVGAATVAACSGGDADDDATEAATSAADTSAVVVVEETVVIVQETVTASPGGDTGEDDDGEGDGSGDGGTGDGGETAPPFPANTDPDFADPVGDPAELVDVRLSRQDGYDRIEWEFDGGGTPGWIAEYTDDPTAAGSGEPVLIGGDAVLSLTMIGVAIPGSLGLPGGPPVLGSVTVPGDVTNVVDVDPGSVFEGRQDAFVGVTAELPFRVISEQDPTRVVLEIRDS